METRKRLISWVSSRTRDYDNVEIRNLTTSFRNGMAFCAIVHSIDNSLLKFDDLKPDQPKLNLFLAFDLAERKLGIPKLLEVGDVLNGDLPDSMLITTYLLEFVKKYPNGNIRNKRVEVEMKASEEGDGNSVFLVSQEEIDRMIAKKKKERKLKEEEKKKNSEEQLLDKLDDVFVDKQEEDEKKKKDISPQSLLEKNTQELVEKVTELNQDSCCSSCSIL